MNHIPRKARIDAPGALLHIIGRGIDRRKIFFEDSDRDDFFESDRYPAARKPNPLFRLGTYSKTPALEDGRPSDRHGDAQAPDRVPRVTR